MTAADETPEMESETEARVDTADIEVVLLELRYGAQASGLVAKINHVNGWLSLTEFGANGMHTIDVDPVAAERLMLTYRRRINKMHARETMDAARHLHQDTRLIGSDV